MKTHITPVFLVLAAGILITIIAGMWFWKIQEIQPYDTITFKSANYLTDVDLYEKGDYVGSVSLRLAPIPDYRTTNSVDVQLALDHSHSRYRLDSAEFCVIPPGPGMDEIFFEGYPEGFPPGVYIWYGNNRTPGCINLQTPERLGESTLNTKFIARHNKNENETITLILDAQIRESRPPWRRGRIQIPVTFNLTGCTPEPVATETGKTQLMLMTSRDRIDNNSLPHVAVTQLLDAGTIVDEEDYKYYASVYTTKLIRSYGPVPAYAADSTVVSLGILGEIANSEARVAMLNKLE